MEKKNTHTHVHTERETHKGTYWLLDTVAASYSGPVRSPRSETDPPAKKESRSSVRRRGKSPSQLSVRREPEAEAEPEPAGLEASCASASALQGNINVAF